MKIKTTILAALGVCAALHLAAGNLRSSHFPDKEPLPAVKNTRAFMQSGSDGDRTPRQVVKLNLTQLAFRNLSAQYEYGFHKNFSGALGLNFFLPRNLPALFADDDPEGKGLRDPRYQGFGITPEFRFYPGHKKVRQAPAGFYIAAYMRFARYKLTSGYNVEVQHPNNTKTIYGYDMTATYKGYTSGFMLGWQWIIGKHFSIDWWIAGAGGGRAKLDMNAVGTGFSLSPSEQEQVKASIRDQFDDVKYLGGTPSVETTANTARVNVTGLPMLSFRGFGLALGFAF